mgnify:FL=1
MHHNHVTKQSAFFHANGAVQLNHVGNKKFETTSTGAIITGIATVTGNLSIGGTVTYEDVSNVDSIGVITARSGIVASGDVTISKNSPSLFFTDTSGAINNFSLNNNGGVFRIKDETSGGVSRFTLSSSGVGHFIGTFLSLIHI